jgi:serine/threonine protein kinase
MLTEFTDCEQVGKGSYGEVVRAESKNQGSVAIKRVEILDKNQDSDWENGVRLVREIFFLRNLKHPNLSSLISLFPNKGPLLTTLHIVSKYYTQGSLSEYGPASLAEVLSIQLQVMEGLRYLHAHQVIHRDIKRENIFVDIAAPDGNKRVDVVIGDFGLSRSLVRSAMTSEVVTKPYRCPSLLLGATEYGAEIDVFAAGLVFMEMLSGKLKNTMLPNRKMGLKNFIRFQIALTKLSCAEKGEPEMLSARLCELADRMHVDLFELIDSVRSGSEYEDKLALEWGNQAWQLVGQKYSPCGRVLGLAKKMIDFDPSSRIGVAAIIADPLFDNVRRRPVRVSGRKVQESFDKEIGALNGDDKKAAAVKQAILDMMSTGPGQHQAKRPRRPYI